MSNIQIHKGNLLRFNGAAYVSKMDLEKGCFRCANWGLHVGLQGVLPLATGKKYKKFNNPPEPWLATLLEHFPFPLKLPVMLTLEPPSVNTGQFPLESVKTCRPVKGQDGGVAVSQRNRFKTQFPSNEPLTRFVVSRSANVVNWLLTRFTMYAARLPF